MRDLAVQLAATQQPDAWTLNDSAWDIVKLPSRTAQAYRLALKQAQAAVRLHDKRQHPQYPWRG